MAKAGAEARNKFVIGLTFVDDEKVFATIEQQAQRLEERINNAVAGSGKRRRKKTGLPFDIKDYERLAKAIERTPSKLKNWDRLISKIKTTRDELRKLANQYSKLDDTVKQAIKSQKEKVKSPSKPPSVGGRRIDENSLIAARMTKNEITDVFKRVALWSSGVALLFSSLRGLKSAFSETIGLSDSLLELQKIMGNTFPMEKFRGEIKQLAYDFGRNITDVVGIVKIWAQQGYNWNESLRLTELTLRGVNSALIDVGDSVEFLTSIMRSFNLEIGDLTSLWDKIMEIQRSYAITSREIADGLRLTASIGHQLGEDIDTLIGYITAIKEVTRDTGKQTGQALKTIFSRLFSPEIIRYLNALGVATENIYGGKLPPHAIFGQIREKVQSGEIPSQQLVDIAKQLGGVRKYREALILLQRLDVVEQVRAKSLLAVGTALQGNAIEMQKFERRLSQLKTAWQSFFDIIYRQGDFSILNIFSEYIKLMTKLGETMRKIASSSPVLVELFSELATFAAIASVGKFGLRQYNKVVAGTALKSFSEAASLYQVGLPQSFNREFGWGMVSRILKEPTGFHAEAFNEHLALAFERTFKRMSDIRGVDRKVAFQTIISEEYRSALNSYFSTINSDVLRTKEVTINSIRKAAFLSGLAIEDTFSAIKGFFGKINDSLKIGGISGLFSALRGKDLVNVDPVSLIRTIRLFNSIGRGVGMLLRTIGRFSVMFLVFEGVGFVFDKIQQVFTNLRDKSKSMEEKIDVSAETTKKFSEFVNSLSDFQDATGRAILKFMSDQDKALIMNERLKMMINLYANSNEGLTDFGDLQRLAAKVGISLSTRDDMVKFQEAVIGFINDQWLKPLKKVRENVNNELKKFQSDTGKYYDSVIKDFNKKVFDKVAHGDVYGFNINVDSIVSRLTSIDKFGMSKIRSIIRSSSTFDEAISKINNNFDGVANNLAKTLLSIYTIDATVEKILRDSNFYEDIKSLSTVLKVGSGAEGVNKIAMTRDVQRIVLERMSEKIKETVPEISKFADALAKVEYGLTAVNPILPKFTKTLLNLHDVVAETTSNLYFELRSVEFKNKIRMMSGLSFNEHKDRINAIVKYAENIIKSVEDLKREQLKAEDKFNALKTLRNSKELQDRFKSVLGSIVSISMTMNGIVSDTDETLRLLKGAISGNINIDKIDDPRLRSELDKIQKAWGSIASVRLNPEIHKQMMEAIINASKIAMNIAVATGDLDIGGKMMDEAIARLRKLGLNITESNLRGLVKAILSGNDSQIARMMNIFVNSIAETVRDSLFDVVENKLNILMSTYSHEREATIKDFAADMMDAFSGNIQTLNQQITAFVYRADAEIERLNGKFAEIKSKLKIGDIGIADAIEQIGKSSIDTIKRINSLRRNTINSLARAITQFGKSANDVFSIGADSLNYNKVVSYQQRIIAFKRSVEYTNKLFEEFKDVAKEQFGESSNIIINAVDSQIQYNEKLRRQKLLLDELKIAYEEINAVASVLNQSLYELISGKAIIDRLNDSEMGGRGDKIISNIISSYGQRLGDVLSKTLYDRLGLNVHSIAAKILGVDTKELMGKEEKRLIALDENTEAIRTLTQTFRIYNDAIVSSSLMQIRGFFVERGDTKAVEAIDKLISEYGKKMTSPEGLLGAVQSVATSGGSAGTSVDEQLAESAATKKDLIRAVTSFIPTAVAMLNPKKKASTIYGYGQVGFAVGSLLENTLLKDSKYGQGVTAALTLIASAIGAWNAKDVSGIERDKVDALNKIAENTSYLKKLDEKLINAPSGFVLPNGAISGTSIGQININIDGAADPKTVAEHVMDKIDSVLSGGKVKTGNVWRRL